jgi:aminoglycoside phosphotransferase (APT) family kinase protein
MTKTLARRHRAILDGLEDWYSRVDQQPKTLLYGDVNPQNLAFAKTADGFQLSVFDWERAIISLPQRDLAEHLIYTLPDDFSKPEALDQIDLYLAAFARYYEGGTAQRPSLEGLVWMLYDLIINRLPLMMIVNHVAHKRRHAGKAYSHAHRLLSYLN